MEVQDVNNSRISSDSDNENNEKMNLLLEIFRQRMNISRKRSKISLKTKPKYAFRQSKSHLNTAVLKSLKGNIATAIDVTKRRVKRNTFKVKHRKKFNQVLDFIIDVVHFILICVILGLMLLFLDVYRNGSVM